jgi:thiol:disulfide interchange protein DsbA
MRFLVSLVLLLSFSVSAQYKEGTHYTTLDLPRTENPELREYFSFYCPACYQVESFIPEINANLSNGIKVTKTHAAVLPQASKDVQQWLAVGYEAAKQMGKTDLYVSRVFDFIHGKKGAFLGKETLHDIFIAMGLTNDEAKKYIGSFAIRSRAKKHERMTSTLTSKGGLRSVPTFVAHGRYVLDLRSFDQNNIASEIANITNYLYKK